MSNLTRLKVGDPGPTGKRIKEAILVSDTFIVYLDEDDVIQWYTEDYDKFAEHFGEVQNKVSDWESKANRLFDKEESYEIKTLLAEAYARILDDKDIELAREVIELAADRIRTQGVEILKQNYSVAALVTTLVDILAIILTKICKISFIQRFGRDEYNIWMTVLFGGIGAFLFTVVRLKKYQANILIGKKIHILDGCLRIFYGMIAGLVISIAIRSNLVLGFLNKVDNSIYVTIFMGICAGFSEVLVPDLIQQIQSKSSK